MPPKLGKKFKLDPGSATWDKDYSADEIEFLQAVEAYRKEHGRKFIAATEFLDIAKSLGYWKGKA